MDYDELSFYSKLVRLKGKYYIIYVQVCSGFLFQTGAIKRFQPMLHRRQQTNSSFYSKLVRLKVSLHPQTYFHPKFLFQTGAIKRIPLPCSYH